jgi:hypothetical protein
MAKNTLGFIHHDGYIMIDPSSYIDVQTIPQTHSPTTDSNTNTHTTHASTNALTSPSKTTQYLSTANLKLPKAKASPLS